MAKSGHAPSRYLYSSRPKSSQPLTRKSPLKTSGKSFSLIKEIGKENFSFLLLDAYVRV